MEDPEELAGFIADMIPTTIGRFNPRARDGVMHIDGDIDLIAIATAIIARMTDTSGTVAEVDTKATDE